MIFPHYHLILFLNYSYHYTPLGAYIIDSIGTLITNFIITLIQRQNIQKSLGIVNYKRGIKNCLLNEL